MIRGMEHPSSEERLRAPGLFNLERRPYSNIPVPKGGLQESQRGTFRRECSDRERGNYLKLKEGQFRLDILLFAMRVVRHWNRLHIECFIPGSVQGKV